MISWNLFNPYLGDKIVHAFHKGISLKPAYFEVTIQHFSHWTTDLLIYIYI